MVFIIIFCISEKCGMAASQWTDAKPMNKSRAGLAAVVLDEKIYALGGWNNPGGGGTCLNTVETYMPDSWTSLTDQILPGFCSKNNCGHYGSAAVAAHGKIYVLGGKSLVSSPYGYPYSDVQEYDPNRGTWVMKASMPLPRAEHAAVLLNGKIYVMGGYVGAGGVTKQVHIYDPSNNTWTVGTPMLNPRSQFGAAVINGKIYVMGGLMTTNTGSSINAVEEYDPSNGTWVSKTPMLIQRNDFATAVLDGKIYVMGGMGGYVFSDTVDEYDPSQDFLGGTPWTRKDTMTLSNTRNDFSAVTLKGKIHLLGGKFKGQNLSLATHEIYGESNTDIGFRMKDSTGVVRIACQLSTAVTSPLRVARNGKIYGIALVDPSDPSATPLRVKTSSGIKAVAKLD